MSNANTPSSDSSQSRKNALIIAGAAFVVLGGAAAAWAFWPTPVPPPTASADQLVKFAATEKFKNMSAAEKKPYVDALTSLDREKREEVAQALPEEQRRDAMRSVFEAAMIQRVNTYFEIKDPAERIKYIDQQIDEMEERMRNRPEGFGPPGGPGGPGGDANRGGGDRPRGGFGDPARQKERLERFPAEQRQKFAEFMAEVRKRREERGLPSPWERRGNGGGGGNNGGGSGR